MAEIVRKWSDNTSGPPFPGFWRTTPTGVGVRKVLKELGFQSWGETPEYVRNKARLLYSLIDQKRYEIIDDDETAGSAQQSQAAQFIYPQVADSIIGCADKPESIGSLDELIEHTAEAKLSELSGTELVYGLTMRGVWTNQETRAWFGDARHRVDVRRMAVALAVDHDKRGGFEALHCSALRQRTYWDNLEDTTEFCRPSGVSDHAVSTAFECMYDSSPQFRNNYLSATFGSESLTKLRGMFNG